MKEKIIFIFIFMLIFPTIAGAFSIDMPKKLSNEKNFTETYSHDILGEYFTMTTCQPCKYSHRALQYLYQNKTKWNLPFYYVTMIYDLDGNKWAKQRHDELEIEASPTVAWDGGYKKDKGSSEVIENDMETYNTSIIACGNRNVKDIDLNLDVEWLGAVNINPEDGDTGVPIEQHMTWTNSEMQIGVEVTCNEAGMYNGHLHVYVTEINSTIWDDKWGDPYTFAFLDYAWNEDVDFSGGGTWDDSNGWDGYDHQTGYGQYYENITQDNIMVIASIFDEDNDDYADETTGFVAGIDTDPKTFNVYFGNTTNPPLVVDNGSIMEWFPKDGLLEFGTKYYWKIDVWDYNGNVTLGDIMTFTTRDNFPPNPPSNPDPWNGSTTVPIKANLTWTCNDPDWDDIYYDVYFGDNPDFNMTQVAFNQSETWWNTPTLQFQKKYYWYIVAWDEYEFKTIGDLWHFTTEPNYPPDKASNPYPNDGESAVPVNVTLTWNGSDPNFGDTLTYDVYFDDVNPPVQKTFNQTETIYDPYGTQNLSLYNDYFWKVDTRDSQGVLTPGDVWTFTTGINDPPTDPQINGPNVVIVGKEKEFTFVSTDPNNHTIKYYINWGDGNSIETEYHPSGEVVNLTHAWNKTGLYTLRAKAEDHLQAQSEWSEFNVRVDPRSKVINYFLLNYLLERFPILTTLLKNLLKLN